MNYTLRCIRQALSKEECLEILKRNTAGVLSLAPVDGYPYGVPLSYVYDQGKLYFHCAKMGHKIEAIRNDPRVCFTVIDQDEPVPEDFSTNYKSVILFGTARIYTLQDHPDEVAAAMSALCHKYSPKESPERVLGAIERSRNTLSVIEVTIEKMDGKQARSFLKK